MIIDTPPTIGFLTESALFAADEVIVPVDTGYFSLHESYGRSSFGTEKGDPKYAAPEWAWT